MTLASLGSQSLRSQLIGNSVSSRDLDRVSHPAVAASINLRFAQELASGNPEALQLQAENLGSFNLFMTSMMMQAPFMQVMERMSFNPNGQGALSAMREMTTGEFATSLLAKERFLARQSAPASA